VSRLSRGSSLVLAVALLLLSGCTTSKPQTAVPAPSAGAPAAPTFSLTNPPYAPGYPAGDGLGYRKPVIYLYPLRTTSVSVRLTVDGAITKTVPLADSSGAWRVTASPSGILRTSSGQEYPYLFWEADAQATFDMSTGFVIAGRDTRAFLADKLTALGLNASESDAFIAYWAPRMESNAYNLVHFEGPVYERSARLLVTPQPDTQIRVFMVFQPLAAPVDVTPQQLASPASRHGFVLVEWGGTELAAR